MKISLLAIWIVIFTINSIIICMDLISDCFLSSYLCSLFDLFYQVEKWGKIALYLSTISKTISQIGLGNIVCFLILHSYIFLKSSFLYLV